MRQSRRARVLHRAGGNQEESVSPGTGALVFRGAVGGSLGCKTKISRHQETDKALKEGVSVRQTGLLSSLVGTKNRNLCRYLVFELVSQERKGSLAQC